MKSLSVDLSFFRSQFCPYFLSCLPFFFTYLSFLLIFLFYLSFFPISFFCSQLSFFTFFCLHLLFFFFFFFFRPVQLTFSRIVLVQNKNNNSNNTSNNSSSHYAQNSSNNNSNNNIYNGNNNNQNTNHNGNGNGNSNNSLNVNITKSLQSTAENSPIGKNDSFRISNVDCNSNSNSPIQTKNKTSGIKDLSSIIISTSTSEYASRVSSPRHKKKMISRGTSRKGSGSELGTGSGTGSSPFMSPRKVSGSGSITGTPRTDIEKETEREIDGITVYGHGNGRKMR